MADESVPADADAPPGPLPPPDKLPGSAAAVPSTSSPNNNSNNGGSSNNNGGNIEFEPPAACIRRLLKQSLPKSTNVSKDSLSAISRASGIFVLYLTACANDVAREGRRTVEAIVK